MEPDDSSEGWAPARPTPPGSPQPRASAPGQQAGAAAPPPARPSWASLEDGFDEPEPTPPGRRRVLVAVAVLPWIVAGIALLRPTGGAPASPDDAGAVPAVDGSTDGPAVQDDGEGPAVVGTPQAASGRTGHGGALPLHADGPGPVRGPQTSGPLVAPELAEAGAAALRVVHALVGDVGPRDAPPEGLEPLGIPGYVDHATIEAFDHPGPGVLVVRVLLIVLQGVDHWEDLELVRLAVPLRFDADGARPAGAPWRLPVAALELEPMAAADEPVADPELLAEAGAALTAVGYEVSEVLSLARTDAWPWLVTAVARAPGDERTHQQVIWLRPHLGGFVVAGTRPAHDEVRP